MFICILKKKNDIFEEDPDSIGHYSLVLAVEYKYCEKFMNSLNAIEHWLSMIGIQFQYLFALNKYYKRYDDCIKHKLFDDSFGSDWDFELSQDNLSFILQFLTPIMPNAIWKFDQLMSTNLPISIALRYLFYFILFYFNVCCI